MITREAVKWAIKRTNVTQDKRRSFLMREKAKIEDRQKGKVIL